MAGEIDETLARLRRQIEAAVRQEQLRDQLTGLANQAALSEDVTNLLAQVEQRFWIAFVEVDRFKRVNDEFGYDAADALLKEIAKQLDGASALFTGRAAAYRAHGDEFYLMGLLLDGGSGDLEDIQGALTHLSAGVARIRLMVDGHTNPMQCTVTTGWTTSGNAREHEGTTGLTHRTLLLHLEATVAAAKRKQRGSVMMFGPEVGKLACVTLRTECRVCETAFSMDIPKDQQRTGSVFCPNCGEATERPPGPREQVGGIVV